MNTLPAEEYKKSPHTNYSALRLFSVCPRLYYEQYVTKTYVEPERDYFVYGSLVDCILTTPDDLKKKFVRVERTINVADTLKHEVRIKELQNEMEEIGPKADAGNKTAIKGMAAREKELEEVKSKLSAIASLTTAQQVTASIWDNAVETAEAIKRNPSFQQLNFNDFTSQQVMCDDSSHRKGILDYVCFNGGIQTLYSLFKTKHISYEEFFTKIQEVPEEDRKGWIWDVKTTHLISTFDPSIYAGQLAWYREIVQSLTGIRCDCGIIAGDKDPSVKRAQDYILHPSLLDSALTRVREVENTFLRSQEDCYYPGAKEFRGVEQECFRCSICADRPFSNTTPLMVTAPLKLKSR